MKIEEIDKNFVVKAANGLEYEFRNALEKPFALSGFAWFDSEKELRRLPRKVLDSDVNDGVKALAWNTSGGAVRFRTDSASIAVRAVLRDPVDMQHMPRTGSSGFDLYVRSGAKRVFCGNTMPPSGGVDINGVLGNFNARETRELTLYFPLYNGVKELSIGLLPGSKLEAPGPLSVRKPVLFYGSSITQGGCASRPGNAYSHILCRWLDAEMINLGFSGSGRGEPVMAETIASLDLGAFVMDYDHNAPDLAHLEATHEKFFSIIRKKRPLLPVVFVSKPDFDNAPEVSSQRRDVILRTYNNALSKGDKNVFFVDGETLFGKSDRDSCTMDGCHPNDLGFMRMAENILPALKEALKNAVS